MIRAVSRLRKLSAKVAIVSLLAGIDAQAARSRLDEAGGDIRSAVSG